MLGAAAGEAAQHLVRLGGLQSERRGVLDHLVVVGGDEIPVDGLVRQHPHQAAATPRPPRRRPVQPCGPDVLQPRSNWKSSKCANAKPAIEAPWVSVCWRSISALVRWRSSPSIMEATSEAFVLVTWESMHRPPLDVPVHHDPRASVPLVPLGHEVRRPRSELAASPTRTRSPGPTARSRGPPGSCRPPYGSLSAGCRG